MAENSDNSETIELIEELANELTNHNHFWTRLLRNKYRRVIRRLRKQV